MAYLRTMTVLSCNLSMAIAVTGMILSKGRLCFSVRSFRTLSDAALVNDVTSRVRSHRMSKRELRVLAMLTTCLSSLIAFSSSESPSGLASTAGGDKSSRTKMCPMEFTMALLKT